ncbi:MAG TPA: sialidase family protein [Gemmatimonadaceae bacterium]
MRSGVPRVPTRVLSLVLVAGLSSCVHDTGAPPVTGLTMIESPAGPASSEPNLAVDERGRVHLTWQERTSDSTHGVRYAIFDGTSWTTPRTIVERGDLFVNWADFPSVMVAPPGRVLVHWLQRSGSGRYSYEVRVVQSLDDGATWSRPLIPHRDGLGAEHGFVSLFPAEGDSVEAVWLDGRHTVDRTRPREMQLASTRIATDGGLGAEVMLDTRICDCCQTAAAMTSQGPIVVYRDRSADEVRDIAAVRRLASGWTRPTLVYADGWEIAACPVNGPAVAAASDTVVVAWFTGAQDTARVRVAFSFDAGATFGAPVRVDDGAPAGRVDVVLDGTGRAIVSWLERTTAEDAEVRLRAVGVDGRPSGAFTVSKSSAARSSGFPRMVRRGSELVIAWTEPGVPSRVRIAIGHLGNGE